MTEVPVTKLTVSKCPYCQAPLNAATQIEGIYESPQKGDVSICFYCEKYLVYGENLKLEKFTPETWQALGEGTQNQLKRERLRLIELKGA